MATAAGTATGVSEFDLCERIRTDGVTMSMDGRQVMCVSKRGPNFDAHERIEGIGGVIGSLRWWHSERDAISNIQTGGAKYYVNVADQSFELVVAIHNRRKYLKTRAEGYYPEILLALPQCPEP